MTVRRTYSRGGRTFSPGGMIVCEREPLNLEMPFGSLDGFITPVDRFFVRSHFSGAAWTTEAEITKVEISTNGGETWHDTQLLGGPIRNAWRLWVYDWQVPTKPGKATLMARATDSEGRTQPTERDQDRRSYIVNHLLPIEVDVR